MASFRGIVTNVNKDFAELQTISLLKAVGNGERPTKMKHVRKIIMGSDHEQGCGTFWAAVSKLPLRTSKVACWKFCHVLHQLLRDGHPHALHDSLKYIVYLDELGQFWEHCADSYGMLIFCYCKLLVQRLTFHQKHPKLLGNLGITDEDITESTSDDANGYLFEFSIEVLDLMDELLKLQAAVFQSLHRSRASSMTQSGQCRLYPLILCIQDSCQLYDCLVKLLYRLHRALPKSTLDGHRKRFDDQFKSLHQFYQTCSNLQYYKTLVQVPFLPDSPPNFLVAADLSRHRKPVAIVSGEDADDDDESVTPAVPWQVETSPRPTVPPPMQTPSTPPTPVRPQLPEVDALLMLGSDTAQNAPDARDAIIAQLKQQIEHLQNELEFVKTKARERIAELQKTITNLTAQLEDAVQSAELSKMEGAAMKNNLDASVQECTQLLAQLQAVKGNEDAASRLAKAESATKQSEEQLKKMKEVYGQLRKEHIALLRTHAEVKNQWEADKKAAVQISEALQRTEHKLEQLQGEKAELKEALHCSSYRASVEAAEMHRRLADAVQQRESFVEQLRLATNEAADCRTAATKAEAQCSDLAMRLNEALSRQHNATERATLLQKQLGTARDESQKMGAELARTAKELEQLQCDNKILRTSSDHATLKALELKQKLAEADQQHQRLAEKLEAATKQAADSRSAASLAETERLRLISQLEEALSRQHDIAEESRLLSQLLAAERSEAQVSGAALSRTTKQLEQLQCDHKTLQASLDSASAEAAELKQQLGDTKKSHQRTAQELERLQSHKESLQASFDSATSKVAELEQQLDGVKQQRKDLATKLEAAKNEAAEWKSAAEHTRPKTVLEDVPLQVQDSSLPHSLNGCASSTQARSNATH